MIMGGEAPIFPGTRQEGGRWFLCWPHLVSCWIPLCEVVLYGASHSSLPRSPYLMHSSQIWSCTLAAYRVTENLSLAKAHMLTARHRSWQDTAAQSHPQAEQNWSPEAHILSPYNLFISTLLQASILSAAPLVLFLHIWFASCWWCHCLSSPLGFAQGHFSVADRRKVATCLTEKVQELGSFP